MAPARSPDHAGQRATIVLPPAIPARFELRIPDTVRKGDTFLVTLDLQALLALRHLEFSVTYDKSILRLLETSPGAFAQRGDNVVHFEESSDGYLLVRVDFGRGPIDGAGTVAALEFQARRGGASLLSVQEVTYVESGASTRATTPVAHERSITVVD